MRQRWAPGIFRPLDHLVPAGAHTIEQGGHTFFFAACGSVTVQPGIPVPGHRTRCAECLGLLHALDKSSYPTTKEIL